MDNMNDYAGIPAMTPKEVHDYLHQIGSEWSGEGSVVELGCWLGATSAALLHGLVKADFDRTYYAFDRWESNKQQIDIAKEHGKRLTNKQNLAPLFKKHVLSIYKDVIMYKGQIGDTLSRYPGDLIEICLFDAPKKDPIFTKSMNVLSPYFIPGVTIVGLLDYKFYRKRKGYEKEELLAPVLWMHKHRANFEKIKEWPDNLCSCVFFKYIKKIGD